MPLVIWLFYADMHTTYALAGILRCQYAKPASEGSLLKIMDGDSMESNDIDYFRKLLTGMLEEAQQNGDSTIEELTGSNEVFADPADRATAESDRAFTLRLRDRERRLIRKIQAALQRIEDGTYGICEECGEDISIPRLKARPVTRLCINCKARQEADEHQRGD